MNYKHLHYILDATKRQKEMITSWCRKSGKDANEVIGWAESNFKSDADQVSAAYWLLKGYDPKSFGRALYICSQKKLDPLKQDPQKLISDNPDLQPKVKPINPDDVFTDRQEDGEGNVTYAARDEDRKVIREIINTHWGISANPWCLLQAHDGKLTQDSDHYWESYSAYPKRIAFRNGRLLAFSAGNVPNFREWWDRFDRSFPFIPYNGKTWKSRLGTTYKIVNGDVLKFFGTAKARLYRSYSEDIEDADAEVSYDPDNNTIECGREVFDIDHQDDKFFYVDDYNSKFKVRKEDLTFEGEFTYSNGRFTTVENYRHGIKHGPYKYYRGDVLVEEGDYVNGSRVGDWKSYTQFGVLASCSVYKNDELCKVIEYYDSGNVSKTVSYSNGYVTGPWTEYYEDGSIKYSCNYTIHGREGEAITYFPNGVVRQREHYVDGIENGLYEEYYPNGQLKISKPIKDGEVVGTARGYSEDGTLKVETIWKDDSSWPVKRSEFYPSGNLKRVVTYDSSGDYQSELVYFENGGVFKAFPYVNGLVNGVATVYYPNGNVHELAQYKGGDLNGEVQTYDEDGTLISRKLYRSDVFLKDLPLTESD